MKLSSDRFLSLAVGFVLLLAGCDAKVGPVDPVSESMEVSSPSSKEVASPVATESGDAKLLIEGGLDSVDWSALVGKEVVISGNLTVVDTYDLIRRGQVKVARDRLYIPTNHIDPNDADPAGNSFEGGSNVKPIVESIKRNDQLALLLDDGESSENVFPPKLFPELGQDQPTVRVGSVIRELSGTLKEEKGKFVFVPKLPLNWTPAPRPVRPSVGSAKLAVASFNVLNFFTTIDNGKNQARGADTEDELKRQQAKLVAAILGLQADVVGLMELENNLESEQRLVAALNDAAGKDIYQGCGLPAGFSNAPGGQNAIRVGIIYRSDRVQPVGEVTLINDPAFAEARTPVVQRFKTDGVEPFAVIVNHFKSKGGSSRADAANKNQGDGQGAYNATRRGQSLAICSYLDDLEKASGAVRALVIGDLNAYAQEDPIDAMRARGLVDLHETFQSAEDDSPNGQHSFLYYGQSGSLDHAMATSALAEDITGVATWHINADEPRFLDYNQEYNPEALYQADPFRSSDHDPVVIGIGQ